MEKLTEIEVFDLSEKAIKRTKRIGAKNFLESIALLEKEIEGYRKKIFRYEKDLAINKKEEQPINGTIESISIPNITINADTVHLTVYPSGILDEEKEAKDNE